MVVIAQAQIAPAIGETHASALDGFLPTMLTPEAPGSIGVTTAVKVDGSQVHLQRRAAYLSVQSATPLVGTYGYGGDGSLLEIRSYQPGSIGGISQASKGSPILPLAFL